MEKNQARIEHFYRSTCMYSQRNRPKIKLEPSSSLAMAAHNSRFLTNVTPQMP
jgi:hypothetical protein